MLLRRITQHVQNQNWFAVFIDFIIVVVGVFIGIQVANWNEALREKQAEKVYLERMHEDIKFAQAFVEESIRRRIRDFEASLVMIEIMNEDGSELTDEYIECALPSSINILIDLPFLNTIKELLETGKVNILDDAALRNGILELQNRSELLTRFQDLTLSSIINITNEFSNSIKQRASRGDADEIRLVRHCNLKALHANNRFINAISENMDIADAFINKRLIPWSEQIEKLHQLIDQSLNLSHP
ncbi:hypothetical protein OS175_12780 [Marinicella sp. S1101]|uniref:hypothetical protein n=1 Tax=Marinicella marina TaxID=2996016 RepID=UPI00226085D1|nr:hypothetical protein [Marinicella marina]MCX7554749.1 hypothetical protein [Marinicella marina]MDJ1141435.1 hypothetical protein [Marinicella marina]